MPRVPTQRVSQEDLDALFDELDIWNQIYEGILTSEPVESATAPSRSYLNSTSQILKHLDSSGIHVVTTHRIIDNSTGEIHHWHGKDILVDGVRLVVVGEP